MIVIASGKGGVGKSTIAANLGVALGQLKQQVCIFDADTNLANINILFGVTPEHTLQACISGEKRLEQILLPVSDHLQIVPAASGIAEFIELAPEQQEHLLDGLKRVEQSHDLILIDSAAGIGTSQLNFFLAASWAILVITPEPTSLTDAFSFLKIAKRYGFDRTVHVMVNMASDLHAARSAFKRFKHATEQYLQLDVGYLGYVLQDHHVPESVRKQKPVMLTKPECLASRCIRVITERLFRLLQNEKTNAGALSSYLSEMNQPFGEETWQSKHGVSLSALDADWQRQALTKLQEMDKDQVVDFLHRAISEWAIHHDSDEQELIGSFIKPDIHVISAGQDTISIAPNNNVTRLNVGTRMTTSSPRLQTFQNEIAQSPYCAAIQFAELLAKVEKA